MILLENKDNHLEKETRYLPNKENDPLGTER